MSDEVASMAAFAKAMGGGDPEPVTARVIDLARMIAEFESHAETPAQALEVARLWSVLAAVAADQSRVAIVAIVQASYRPTT